MTNQQILEKAIQKAIDGGWNPDTERNKELLYYRNELEAPVLIFSHDFAKALWGEECILQSKGAGHSHYSGAPTRASCFIAWQHHLQQMVIADDPIKYLGEHL